MCEVAILGVIVIVVVIVYLVYNSDTTSKFVKDTWQHINGGVKPPSSSSHRGTLDYPYHDAYQHPLTDAPTPDPTHRGRLELGEYSQVGKGLDQMVKVDTKEYRQYRSDDGSYVNYGAKTNHSRRVLDKDADVSQVDRTRETAYHIGNVQDHTYVL